MNEAIIFDAIRTPRGRGKKDGALYPVRPMQLAANLFCELERRNALNTEMVDDVILGCVSAVGEQGGNIAKIAPMVAGWHPIVSGMTLNRFCASGLEAINLAAMKVRSGWETLVVAGGVESMSRVPMGSDGGAWAFDPETNMQTDFIPQGVSADLIATLEDFSREQLDEFAVESHRRAAQAWEEQRFAKSIVAVPDRNGQILLERDETIRPATNTETLSQLKPAFAMPGDMGFDSVALRKYHQLNSIEHRHTAGNSSGIVDGAALLLIGNEQVGKRLGLKPRARIVATAVVGSEPTIMLTGPAPATQKALAKAGLKVSDIDLFEVNEAFAAVVLKFCKDLDLSMDRVNVNGGAIAMGHPLGATGAMILGTLLEELERTQGRYGLCTLCVGAGMGIATIIERI